MFRVKAVCVCVCVCVYIYFYFYEAGGKGLYLWMRNSTGSNFNAQMAFDFERHLVE
jgi:hypothetical protein